MATQKRIYSHGQFYQPGLKNRKGKTLSFIVLKLAA